METAVLDRLFPMGFAHQGLAVLVHPLRPEGLEDVLLAIGSDSVVVVLDQVTDPRNVGAVLRSATLFGAKAVIVQARTAPPESAVLAKAASGALDHVPLIRVSNLARALDKLGEAGVWRIGLAGNSSQTLSQAVERKSQSVALVLGAEGTGLRRLTAENCDVLAHIPMSPTATQTGIDSLNVSAAAAVALYAATEKPLRIP